MQVILIDDVFELGRRGDVIRVADGYGRNYLIPKHLAVPATPGNLKMVEQQRVSLAKKETHDMETAEILAQELSQLHILISRKSGETGVLFGSVTSKDLSEVLEAKGISLDRRKIRLAQPIKAIGNYRVEARPHSEVESTLLVSVLPEADEPVSQTIPRGEESDQIIEDLNAKIADLEGPTGDAPAGESVAEVKGEPKSERTSESEQTAGKTE
jgi:large subunit ribosomal protein L9